MRLRPRRTLGQVGSERQEPRRLALPGEGEAGLNFELISAILPGSQESARLVFSDTENLEEEEEIKEGDAEVESQIDIPAAEVHDGISLQPTYPFPLQL